MMFSNYKNYFIFNENVNINKGGKCVKQKVT